MVKMSHRGIFWRKEIIGRVVIGMVKIRILEKRANTVEFTLIQ
jgi:hypothetical protein